MPGTTKQKSLFQALSGGQYGLAIGQITGYLKKNLLFQSYVNRRMLRIEVGDETTAITTGNGKKTFRMPYAMKLTDVRASLNVVSSVGIPTVDINVNGVTLLTTKLTIDATEKTSKTAAIKYVFDATKIILADDAEITIDIDVAGTGAAGLKVTLIGEEII